MRKLLNVLSDYKLLDGKPLTSRNVIEIMASDNPLVYDSDGCYNLELEITFLEFFEILIGCAVYTNNSSSSSNSGGKSQKSNNNNNNNTASNNNTAATVATSSEPNVPQTDAITTTTATDNNNTNQSGDYKLNNRIYSTPFLKFSKN